MGRGNSGHQKVDHGGDFIQIPRRVLRSPAYLALSCRARSALLVVLDGFNGFNNGKIGLSIKNLGAALGNQNDGANSRAIAELIEHDLLECMSDASHVKSRAREYRVTFIASKAGAATNEWRGWTAGNGKKIGTEATAARKRKLAEATAARRKLSTEATAARGTETRRVGGRFRAEATAAHIGNQYIPPAAVDLDAGNSFRSVDELRTALNAFLATGAATATDVCRAIDLPAGTMSKFRSGRGLPEAYRGPMQLELGRRDAFSAISPSTSPSPSPVNEDDPMISPSPAKSAPRDIFGSSSEPFPQKGETTRDKVRPFPHPGAIEKIGRCIGTPMPINLALPRPPWRALLGGVTRDVTPRHAAGSAA